MQVYPGLKPLIAPFASPAIKVKRHCIIFFLIVPTNMSDFLEQHQKALLLIGCLPLPFDSATITMITRFVASAVGKISRLRTEKLRELEAP